ncbi:MAG: hypothetical protein GW880_09510, partial [Armatimonadetes bacterium]|nr:hypothetical protein [Armatimonadota bacterium]
MLVFAAMIACSVLRPAMAAEGTNLVANPNFEQVDAATGFPVAWSQVNGAPCKPMDDGGHTGAHYLRMIDEAADAGMHCEAKRVPAR